MSDTQEGGQVAPAEEKSSPDALRSVFHHSDALEVLDIYRALSFRESERVYAFVQEARLRQNNPARQADFALMESFWMFVGDYRDGDPMEETCRLHDLTEVQYNRYRDAWLAIVAVGQEVEALCLALYGPAPEGGQED